MAKKRRCRSRLTQRLDGVQIAAVRAEYMHLICLQPQPERLPSRKHPLSYRLLTIAAWLGTARCMLKGGCPARIWRMSSIIMVRILA